MSVLTLPGGDNSSLVIEYQARSETPATVRLTFTQVMSYEWTGFDYYCLVSDPDDIEFDLIEITDSAKLLRLAEKARLPGVVVTEDERVAFLESVALHHYRLGFDDHGTYDIVCAELVSVEILTDAAVDGSAALGD